MWLDGVSGVMWCNYIDDVMGDTHYLDDVIPITLIVWCPSHRRCGAWLELFSGMA